MHYIHQASGFRSWLPTLYCWIRVAHICHHWREVALQTPRLWATLDIGRYEPILELLSRSKQAPLSIKAHSSRAQDQSLSQVFKAFPRIQDLELTLSTRHYDLLASEFPKVAPQLRRIVISRSLDSFGMPSDLPKIFDNCSLPSLENLQIENYRLNWTHSILVPTLSRLTVLSAEVYDNRTRPMLDAIQTMPLLQHLDLTRVGPLRADSVDTLPPITHQITLPVLVSFRLSDEISTCASIIQQIVFPSTTTVTLDITNSRDEGQLALFAPVIYGKLTGTGVIGPCTPILSAGLWQYWEGSSSSHLACWRETYPPEELHLSTHPASFRITFRSHTHNFVAILKQYNAIIPAVKVNTFAMVGGGLGLEAHWTSVLAKMPSIVTMRVTHYPSDSLVKLLSTRTFLEAPKKGSRRRSNFLLEHLRVLALEQIPFGYDDDEFLEGLVKAFKARRRSRHRLETLRIVKCFNVGQSIIDVLRSDVGQVIWDGFEEEDSGEMSDEDSMNYRDSEDDYMDGYMDDYMEDLDDYGAFPLPFGIYDGW